MLSPEPCRHVGKVLLHGLLEGQIPVPIVADRGNLMVSTVLGKVNSEAWHQALKLVVEKGTLLVSNRNRSYLMCAEALGVRHEVHNLYREERPRRVFCIHTVNNYHTKLKSFLYRYQGMVTKYLDNYLCWFHLVEPEKNPPLEKLSGCTNKHM